MTLKIRPITLREANAFVAAHHRHHRPPQGAKWAICVQSEGRIVGVAIVGRPVARSLDDGLTCEVTRLCTDGTLNACSKLYGAARRVAGAMGYERVVTYILASESGASLRAAGWTPDASVPGRSWNTPSRPRSDRHPTTDKVRYVTEAPK